MSGALSTHLHDAAMRAAEHDVAPPFEALCDLLDVDPDSADGWAICAALTNVFLLGARLGAVEMAAQAIEQGVKGVDFSFVTRPAPLTLDDDAWRP